MAILEIEPKQPDLLEEVAEAPVVDTRPIDKRIVGPLGRAMLVPNWYSTAEIEARLAEGLSLRFDCVPPSAWHYPDGTLMHGEEMLGKDF